MLGGVGFRSPVAFFDPTISPCTFTIVCIVDYLNVKVQSFESVTLTVGEELAFSFDEYA